MIKGGEATLTGKCLSSILHSRLLQLPDSESRFKDSQLIRTERWSAGYPGMSGTPVATKLKGISRRALDDSRVQERAPASADPQDACLLSIEQHVIVRVIMKRDVKAYRVTQASPHKGLSSDRLCTEAPAPEFMALPSLGEAMFLLPSPEFMGFWTFFFTFFSWFSSLQTNLFSFLLSLAALKPLQRSAGRRRNSLKLIHNQRAGDPGDGRTSTKAIR